MQSFAETWFEMIIFNKSSKKNNFNTKDIFLKFNETWFEMSFLTRVANKFNFNTKDIFF